MENKRQRTELSNSYSNRVDLSPDSVAQVLSFLSCKEHCTVVRVNRTWHAGGSKRQSWCRIAETLDPRVVAFLTARNFPPPQKLHLLASKPECLKPQIPGDWKANITTCVIASICHSDTSKLAERICKHCPNIGELSIQCGKCDGGLAVNYGQLLLHLKNCFKLTVQCNGPMLGRGMTHTWPNLRIVRFEQSVIQVGMLHAFGHWLESTIQVLPHIEELGVPRIESAPVSLDSRIHFVNALGGRTPKLTTLHMDLFPLTAVLAPYLKKIDALSCIYSLPSLEPKNNKQSRLAMYQLLGLLGSNWKAIETRFPEGFQMNYKPAPGEAPRVVFEAT